MRVIDSVTLELEISEIKDVFDPINKHVTIKKLIFLKPDKIQEIISHDKGILGSFLRENIDTH